MFKKDELKLLWPFYACYLIFGLSAVIAPFSVIYFLGIGFSFLQISAITAVFAIAMVLFEIPTGAFADCISRKKSVIIGALISGFSAGLVAFTNNFYAILVIFFLSGFGMTFISGALEAWVIDDLNKARRKDLHHEFFIKAQSIGAFGSIVPPLIAAVIVKHYSIRPLWLIFGISFLLCAVLLIIFGKETFRPKTSGFRSEMSKIAGKTGQGIRFTLKHKTLRLIVLGALFASLIGVAGDGWQPFLVSLSMPVHYLGYVIAVVAFIGMIMPFLSKAFTKFKVKHVLSAFIFVRIILLGSLLLIFPPLFFLGIMIYILQTAVFHIGSPLLSVYFHRFTESKIRATVVSTASMANMLAAAILALGAGALLDIFGPQKVLALSGVFGLFAIAAFLKIKE